QAPVEARVTLNGQTVQRHSNYFHLPLVLNNKSGAVDALAQIRAALMNSVRSNEGRIFQPGQPESFRHDADGNLISDGRWNYNWDQDQRLIEIEPGAGVPDTARRKVAFTYDYRGRRLAKTAWTWDQETLGYRLSTCLRFLYDGWRLLAEVN